MDNELFELCKEVYKRTGWDKTKDSYKLYRDGMPVPLYTSDYLLEKLPLYINREPRDELSLLKFDGGWSAGYFRAMNSGNGVQYLADKVYVADTPLKALLKLTIALKDEGVKL